MSKFGINVNLENLKYELRMLIGANKMTRLFEEKDMGNPTSLFKDSVYLHARNLYSFFHKNKDKDFMNSEYNMKEYSDNWMKPLNDYVMHIYNTEDRDNNRNVVNGEHLNTKVHFFTEDIIRLWKEWIDNAPDKDLKQELKNILVKAQKEAEHDYSSSKSRIMSNNKK